MLNIKHPEADRLARVLANQLGETITDVVIEALREKLLREQGRRMPVEMKASLLEIGHRCAALPDKDTRSPDDILGYDSDGLPS
jgi:antitoxin VapB